MFVSFSLDYARAAAGISSGTEFSSKTMAGSPALIYLTSFSYSLFGINDLSSVLFVLICSLGEIILAFLFGKLLFNEKTGLLAAFLVSFFPLEVHYATQLVSDVPAAFFVSLGVYVFLYAEMKKPHKLLYLGSGLLVGLGYLMQESSILIGLFLIGYTIYRKKRTGNYFLPIVGFAIVIILESLLFLKLSGDPFYRLHEFQMQLEALLNGSSARMDLPMGLLHYPWMFLTVHLVTFFYLFVGISVYFFIRFRKNGANILLLWLIVLILYLSFGTISIRAYVPFSAIERYLSFITIPALLLLAYFLLQKDKMISQVVLPSCLVILLVTSLGTLALREDRKQTVYLKEFASFAAKSDTALYMDSRTKSAIEYLNDFSVDPDIKSYDEPMPKGSYFVVDKKMISKLREAGSLNLPKEAFEAPKQWKLVKTFASEQILVYLVS